MWVEHVFHSFLFIFSVFVCRNLHLHKEIWSNECVDDFYCCYFCVWETHTHTQTHAEIKLLNLFEVICEKVSFSLVFHWLSNGRDSRGPLERERCREVKKRTFKRNVMIIFIIIVWPSMQQRTTSVNNSETTFIHGYLFIFLYTLNVYLYIFYYITIASFLFFFLPFVVVILFIFPFYFMISRLPVYDFSLIFISFFYHDFFNVCKTESR